MSEISEAGRQGLPPMVLPKDFLWGVATASWQNEGCPAAGGGGLSTWDMFARQPGRIANDQRNEFGCDSVAQAADDIRLAAGLGPNVHYRFSFSWPRLLPEGAGCVNARGLDYYDRFIDGLLAAGVTPFPALFWWDLPYALFCRGGWLNRDIVGWFADYVALVAQRYGDRVRRWVVMEEPANFLTAGIGTGSLAPGLKLGRPEVVRGIHHVLLAHGRGVQALRAAARLPAEIGVAPGQEAAMPASAAAADVDAARRQQFAVPDTPELAFGHTLAWWADPLYLGRYPEDGLRFAAAFLPPGWENDLEAICQPMDFFGANVYFGHYYRASAGGRPEPVPFATGFPISSFKWPIVPESAYWVPRFVFERYRVPVVMTETGVSGTDWVARDGRVHDPHRIDFLGRYLAEFARAGRDGVDIRGWFVWTLIDNFEWAAGYEPRFGLVHFDPATRRRTPKDSYAWYAEVVRTHGRAALAGPTPRSP